MQCFLLVQIVVVQMTFDFRLLRVKNNKLCPSVQHFSLIFQNVTLKLHFAKREK